MKEINKTRPVLVTGGTGYLASWIVKQLLEQGFTVHTTVRDKSRSEKYDHLLAAEKNSIGKLVIFEADLLKPGTFEDAMQSCELVIHTASPFKIRGIRNPQKELVEPALQGTRNVLESAMRVESVSRVVLTSSIVAIMGDAIDIRQTENNIFTEKYWNVTSSVNYQPYPYSKTLAEKEAWKIAESQGRWDLVVINPGFILGPSLAPRTDSTSIGMMMDILKGNFRSGVPKGNQAIVDVRDVAKAHILAGFTPGASGRHIAVAHHKSFLDIADVIRNTFPGQYKLPKGYAPKFLLYLVGPLMGFSIKYVHRNTGIDIWFDNSHIMKDLGMEFLPFETTITDQVNQLRKIVNT